jgi:1,4-dihydroxy-2-naphthoate octaprenyltransferase
MVWTNPLVVWGHWRLLTPIFTFLLDNGVIAHTQFAGIYLAVVVVIVVGVHGTRVLLFMVVFVCHVRQLGKTRALQVPAGFVDLVNHQENHLVVRHGVNNNAI